MSSHTNISLPTRCSAVLCTPLASYDRGAANNQQFTTAQMPLVFRRDRRHGILSLFSTMPATTKTNTVYLKQYTRAHAALRTPQSRMTGCCSQPIISIFLTRHLTPIAALSATTTHSHNLRAHYRRIMYTFGVVRRGATIITAKSNGDAALFSLTTLYDNGTVQSFYRDSFSESETYVTSLTLYYHRHIID